MRIPLKMKHIFWVVILSVILTACNREANQDSIESSTIAPTPALETPTGTSNSPANASSTSEAISNGATECNLGLGLRAETIDVIVRYKDQIGFVMTASSALAEEYFSQLEGSIRLIGAPSLAELRQKGQRAGTNHVPYEGLAYGLETGKSTPDEEWQDLVGSTEKAKALADEFDKILVMGPGFKLLSDNERSYGPMGALADIWMLQTQQLQKEPPDSEYRREVERIIKLIRSQNPDIEIWAQITLPPDRVPDAAEWLAYRAEIADLVDGTYIGVYTWDNVDQDQLVSTIEKILQTACEGQ